MAGVRPVIDGMRIRVLLVEGDRAEAERIRNLLPADSFELVTAADLKEARSRLESGKIEVAVADIRHGSLSQRVPTVLLGAGNGVLPRSRLTSDLLAYAVRKAADSDADARRRKRLAALRDIFGAILAARSLDEIVGSSFSHIFRLIPCDRATVALFDFQKKEGCLISRTWGAVDEKVVLPLEQFLPREALETGPTRYIEDIASLRDAPLSIRRLLDKGMRALLMAPLWAEGRLIGDLNLSARRPAQFSGNDREAAREVADLIAIAMHQASLRSAVEAEKTRLADVIRELPAGVIVLDSRNEAVLANAIGERLLSDASAARLSSRLREIPADGKRHLVELEGVDRRVFELSAKGVSGAGRVVVCRETTEERRLQALLQQRDRLSAVGQLAAGIAHDFNNLLCVINGLSALVRSELGEGHPNAVDVDEIQAAGQRAAGLTRQLLAFSRRQLIAPQVLNLNDALLEPLRMLRRLLPDDIEIRAVFDSALSLVKVDPTQISQALVNLVLNARDAMPHGGALSVETANVTAGSEGGAGDPIEPGTYVRLQVSDTGVGMPPEVLARIFEPFFTTKREKGGVGLGLASVYGIVEQSGGRIFAASAPGRGSTFRIYFPVVTEGSGGGGSQSEPPAPPASRGGKTVLVAEDERGIRQMIARILEGRGYRVVSASDGEEALAVAKIHDGNIHLLLTDVLMPGMRGPELARRLLDERPGTRILYISGYSSGILDRHVMENGKAFLQKPFTPEALLRKVREILDGRPILNGA